MTGLGFDMLKNPGKYFESLRGYSSAPTQSSDLAPTKENAARRAAQTPNTTTSEPKRENKNSFGKTFQISEPRYSGSTDYRNTYNRNFGIPTTSNALTANAAGSFKIVGEDVTEKDYSDFFEGFRSINEDEYAKSIKNNPLASTIESSM